MNPKIKKIYELNFVFLTVLFLLISNCTSKDKKNDSRNNAFTILSVNPELEETIDFTSIFDAISYIPLETTESNLIGLVNQVIFSQEKYYLMDEFSIHVFSKKGSHKFSINKYGRGMGEYSYLSWMDIDTANRNIEVYDIVSRKKICYNLENGAFEQEMKWENPYKSFKKISDDRYLCLFRPLTTTNDDHYLHFIDNNGKILKTIIPTPTHLKRIQALPINVFSKVQDYILFQPDYCDTIYKIDNNMGYKPFIAFDFGKYNVEPSVMQRYQSVSDLDKEKPYAYVPFGFIASEKYLYSIVIFRSKIIQLFYSFSTKKLIYSYRLNNNIDGGFFSGPKEIDKDELICLVEPHSLINRYNQIRNKYTKDTWERFINEHEEISDLLNKIESQDNPIIMRLKMDF